VLFIDYDLMMHAVLALWLSPKLSVLGDRPPEVMVMVRPMEVNDETS
jgi:hypothetical protein